MTMSDGEGDVLVMSEVDSAHSTCDKSEKTIITNYVKNPNSTQDVDSPMENSDKIVQDDEIVQDENSDEIVQENSDEIVTAEEATPDEGWEVVTRRKFTRKEQIFQNTKISDDNMKNKPDMSILDKLALHLRDEKVVPVDYDKANKSLHYLRNKWQNWVFGRVIRIQGMYAFFFLYM